MSGKKGGGKGRVMEESNFPSYSDMKQTMRLFTNGGGCVVGNNIAAKQPDVEVLGVFLQDFPLTKPMFDNMLKESAKFGKSRDWVSLKFMILKVGPPGFSKVPYAEGQTYSEVKPLYTLDENDNVVVHPFEKIPNKNKNRGVRKEFWCEEGGPEIDLRSKIIPGMVLSFCMRDDAYSANSVFLDLSKTFKDRIANSNSFAFFQIQATNEEQAKKGNGVKVKKIQIVDDYKQKSMANVLPKTNVEFENIQNDTKVHALSKVMYSGGDRILQITPEKNAYVLAIDKEKDGYWLCYGNEELPYIFIPTKMALNFCCLENVGNCESMAKNILNVAIASEALRMLVRNDKRHSSLIEGGEQNVEISSIHIEIDWNKLMMLHDIQDFQMFPPKNSENIRMVRNKEDTVFWYNPSVTFISPDRETQIDKKYRIVWSVKCKQVSLKVPTVSGQATAMLSDGYAGKFYPLCLSLMKIEDEDEIEVFEKNCFEKGNLLFLKMYQWRPDFAGNCSVLGKRDFFEIGSMEEVEENIEEG